MNAPKHRTRRAPATLLARAAVVAMSALTLSGGAWVLEAAPAAAINPCNDPVPPPSCDDRPPRPFPTRPPTPRTIAPTWLSVSDVGETHAHLAWTDTSGDEASFLVTRYTRETPSATPQVATFPVAAVAGVSSYALDQDDLTATRTVWWTVSALAPGKLSSAAPQVGALTVDLPDHGPLGQLLSFQRDWQADAFREVNPAAALADVVRILGDPTGSHHHAGSIDQGTDTGACGPAAVELALVTRDPGRFVDDVHSLASSGAFTTADGTRYAAHDELRASPKNASTTEANWLFMATLKDAYNAVRITGATSGDDVAWISSPADVDTWLSHVAGLHQTTATAILRPFSTGQTVLPGALRTLRSGGAVVLLVDSSLVGNPPDRLSNPNHYVNLLSWSGTRTKVSFTVATWGHTTDVTTSWNQFNGLTWDVLTAH